MMDRWMVVFRRANMGIVWLLVLLGCTTDSGAAVWLESSPSPQMWNNAYSWSGFPGGVPASMSQVADLSQTDITTNMTIMQTSHDRTISHRGSDE